MSLFWLKFEGMLQSSSWKNKFNSIFENIGKTESLPPYPIPVPDWTLELPQIERHASHENQYQKREENH
jgi:hypothetical protein